jgi:hypothetical protein
MMTPKEANAVLEALRQGELKNGRLLYATPGLTWRYCPVCGSGQTEDLGYEVAIIDARDPIQKADGLQIAFYFRHPKINRACLMQGFFVPAHGALAAQLLAYAEAMQVRAMEDLNAGRTQAS